MKLLITKDVQHSTEQLFLHLPAIPVSMRNVTSITEVFENRFFVRFRPGRG